MLTSQMSEEELIFESKRIVRNIDRRIKSWGGETAVPTYVTERLDDLKERVKTKNIKNLSKKELWNLHRDAKYLNNLESSRKSKVELAKKIELISRVSEKYSAENDKDTRKAIWETYNKLVEEGGFAMLFKYDILALDEVAIKAGVSKEDFREFIVELYNKISLKNPRRSDKIERAFTNALEGFTNKFTSNESGNTIENALRVWRNQKVSKG